MDEESNGGGIQIPAKTWRASAMAGYDAVHLKRWPACWKRNAQPSANAERVTKRLDRLAIISCGPRRSFSSAAALLVLLSRATGAGFVPSGMGLTVNGLDRIGQRRLVFTGQAGAVAFAAIQFRKEPCLECVHVSLPHN